MIRDSVPCFAVELASAALKGDGIGPSKAPRIRRALIAYNTFVAEVPEELAESIERITLCRWGSTPRKRESPTT